MNKPVNKMLGMLGTPKMRDSDGDGVPNILDCKPYNPRKQGWLHDKLKAYKEKSAERKKYQTEVKEGAEAAAREERKKQVVETARFREKQAGERRRKYIQSGGFFGQITRTTSPKPTMTTKIPRGKPIYKYVKKGKHYVRKKVGTTKAVIRTTPTVPKPAPPRKSLMEHMSQYKF